MVFNYIGRFFTSVAMFFINIYRFLDRKGLFGQHSCRFSPSCSVYFEESLKHYGFVRGSMRGIWRILRCNPLNPSWGEDPVTYKSNG